MISYITNCYNRDSYFIYKVIHSFLIITSLISIISYSISIDKLEHQNEVFVRWCLGSSVFTFIYALIALYIDFKRKYDFSRNHFIFLILDIVFILLTFSICVSGSAFWKNGNKNMGKDGFNTGNISLWISFVILVINCYLDYFQHINSVI